MRAYRLSRFWQLIEKFGDSPAQAWRAKAIGERARGLWLQSARSFITAGRKSLDPLEALLVQTGAVDSLARAGRWKEAIRLGTRLVRALTRKGKPELAARVQVNMANAYLWADEYEKARALLHEAFPALDKAGLVEEASAGLLALSTAELFGGDPDKARQYAITARARFRREGKRFYELLCTVNLAQEALLRARGDEALDCLLPLRIEFERFSPPESARAEEFMGYAYLALNLHVEALQCFQKSLQYPATRRTPLNQANCHYGIGMATLQLQRYSQSSRHFHKAQQLYAKVHNPVWEGEAWRQLILLSLITRRVAWNHRLPLRALLPRSIKIIRQFEDKGAPHHIANALLTYAKVLLFLKKQSDPRYVNAIRRALNIIQQREYRNLEWEAHFLLAKSAKSRKKRLHHYWQMLESLWEARLFTISTLSRYAFLRDKAEALQEYLTELLREPTPQVQEALNVITRTRFSALYDEIVHASASPLRKSELKTLNQLREKISAALGNPSPGTPTRSQSPSISLPTLQREWTEIIRPLKRILQQHSTIGNTNGERTIFCPPKGREYEVGMTSFWEDKKVAQRRIPGEFCIVFAETNDRYYALAKEQAIPLPITQDELRERMEWLKFELLAPLSDDTPDEYPLNRLLSSLRTAIIEPWLPGQSPVILSPDGLLWGIPWQALLQTYDLDPVILPSPTFHVPIHSLTLKLLHSPRVVIWASHASDLPSIQKEIQAILRVFPNSQIHTSVKDIINDSEASKINLLHVVGHATHHPQNPMFSHLHFEDAKLTASEIARLPIQPEIVVLSACDTGVLSNAVPSEPDGLVRSFLALGAKTVLASQWALHDRAGADFMRSFYSCLQKYGSILKSLRFARAEMKAKYSHPFFWAPFVLFIGYAMMNGGKRK